MSSEDGGQGSIDVMPRRDKRAGDLFGTRIIPHSPLQGSGGFTALLAFHGNESLTVAMNV
jgi:hypothetical protein